MGIGTDYANTGCASFGALLAILGALMMFTSSRSQKRLKPQYNANLAAWQRAMQRWNELYYCSRDDIVFDPASGQYAPIEQIMGFLYRDPVPAITAAA